jgi:hypothetical protein
MQRIGQSLTWIREDAYMKWFKHATDMLDDVFINGLTNEFGPAGYGIWCGILETYAKYAKENVGDFVEIPWDALTYRLHTSAAKLQRVINYSETKRKLIVNSNPICLEIKIPKMLELRDEWSTRKKKDSGVTRELLGSKNKNKDKETRIKNNTPLPPKGESECFEKFWVEYPKKVAKEATKRSWRAKNLDNHFEAIMAGLKRYKASEQWTKDNGQYIPYPATFLNQSRWMDELESPNHLKLAEPHWMRLKRARFVVNIFTGETYDLEDFSDEPRNVNGNPHFVCNHDSNIAVIVRELRPQEDQGVKYGS